MAEPVIDSELYTLTRDTLLAEVMSGFGSPDYVDRADEGLYQITIDVVDGTGNPGALDFDVIAQLTPWVALNSDGEPQFVTQMSFSTSLMVDSSRVEQLWVQYAGWDNQTVDGTSYMNFVCNVSTPTQEAGVHTNTGFKYGSCGSEAFNMMSGPAPDVQGGTAVNDDTCAITTEQLEAFDIFVNEDDTSKAACWIVRPFTQAALSTLEFGEEVTFSFGFNDHINEMDAEPTSENTGSSFTIPSALEVEEVEGGATTLMAALVTGAAATLLF